MSYGPLRGRRYALGPYANPTSSPSPTTSTTEEHAAFCEAFDLSSLDQNELPVGWTVDEETGYMSFQGELQDYWEIKSGCLLRHHLKPRRKMFSLDQARDCPIPSDRIDRLRVVLTRYSSGRSGIHMDGYAHQNHIHNRPEEEQWTGTTAFQINAATRREMGMYGNLSASQVIKKQKSYEQKKVKKDGSINERNLTCGGACQVHGSQSEGTEILL